MSAPVEIGSSTLVVPVEVAWTLPARIRGLLRRDAPAPGTGFLIPCCNNIHTFFMGYPIDVVFLDGHCHVVDIYPDLPRSKKRTCRQAVMTLELAAGQARSMGIANDQRLTLRIGTD